MHLFSKKDTSYLGVDLGGSLIKLVQLKNVKKRAQLVTYGYSTKPIRDVNDSFLDYPEEMGAMLARLCKESGVTTHRAITALPAPAVFSSIINLPNITKADISSTEKIDEAVRYEAKKIIPLPLEEMTLDWKLLPIMDDMGKNEEVSKKGIQVLLTGAAKKIVRKYLAIFQKANLELMSLETESFALTRSLVGNDKSVIMIVDIGATSTYILIVDHGVPFLDRTIHSAGITITKLFAENLGVTIEQAEQIKFDYANSIFSKKVPLPKIVEDAFSPIINEIQYSFNLYQQDMYGGKNIDRIILSGGTAALPHITEYLSNLLNRRVYVGDPWARISYPEEMKPLLQEIGAKFAIGIGLAMRDIE